MKKNTKSILKAGLVLFIAVMFVASSTAAIENTAENEMFSSTAKTATVYNTMADEIELRYYEEDGLSTVIGLTSSPAVWRSGIRLTQDEMGPYFDWNLTKVNVAFSADNGHPLMEVRIYVYEGDTATKPGPIIVSDTTYLLDTTGVTTIPLVTPVSLEGLDEIWVAVEWYQLDPPPCYYAWMDTLTGPNVWQKSDWVYLNNQWSQLHVLLPTADGRWGIGAIVEGEGGIAELAIANVKGPIGLKADLQNVGEKEAKNVEWSISVTGGILKNVNVSATGTAATLATGGILPMGTPMFIGFGRINIVIAAKAQNAIPISATNTAFLLGPLVIGVK